MGVIEEKEFEETMIQIKESLEKKGIVLESDNAYIHTINHPENFNRVVEWLYENSYEGEVKEVGISNRAAVYALYDIEKISFNDVKEILEQELKKEENFS